MRTARVEVITIISACIMLAGRPAAAGDRTAAAESLLQQASGSIGALVQRVSPSVVQISVTGYRPVTNSNGDRALARTRSIGSGVIVDPAGYILTNAHVIDGAERIEVVLAGDGESNHPPTRVVRATLMGRADESIWRCSRFRFRASTRCAFPTPRSSFRARSCLRSAVPTVCATRSRWAW